MDPFYRIGRNLAATLLAALLAGQGAVCAAGAAGKKAKPVIPLVVPAPGKDRLAPATPSPPLVQEAKAPQETNAPGNTAPAFEELNFNRTLVIEGKVEKPAVQFTLLKESPPEKEIRFEASFLQNILKLDRENTFKAGETYGKE